MRFACNSRMTLPSLRAQRSNPIEITRVKHPCVYIMTNRRNGTLYTGVTSNLAQRAYQHRESLLGGFTARYGCKLLAWYESYDTMVDAIGREKQIKAGSRRKKLELIESFNPTWRDLYDSLI